MLRASNRVLKPGGTAAVYVIAVPRDLGPVDEALAWEAGPEFVAAEQGYEELFGAAGFTEVAITDVTPEYAETAAAWIEAWESERDELGSLLGSDEFRERQQRRANTVRAIHAGLLKRYLVTGTASD